MTSTRAPSRHHSGLQAELRSATKDKGHSSKEVGNYQIIKTLGEGSFGKVKLGTHKFTKQTVAIKIMEKANIKDVDDMERVSREIKILKLLNHENIVKLFEVIESPTHIYLIIEYAEGGELFDYIVAHGRVREREARRFFRMIVSGVDYCHRLNIIHRDLKPENLLLDKNRHIKIVDFGLSNMMKSTNGNMLQTACGSPAYAAPEMIQGKEYFGPLVDIWSMGVILYALVCGFLPFEDPQVPALCNKIVKGEYTTPEFLSKEVKDLIKKMLTLNPKKRITIEKIRKHVWFNKNYPGPPEIPQIFTRRVGTVDLDLIKQIEEFGFVGNEVIRDLTENNHNQATATYMLLAEKKEKERALLNVGLRTLPPPEHKEGSARAEAADAKARDVPKTPKSGRRTPGPANLPAISEDGSAPAPTPAPAPAPAAQAVPVAPRRRRYSIAAGAPAPNTTVNIDFAAEKRKRLAEDPVAAAALATARKAGTSPTDALAPSPAAPTPGAVPTARRNRRASIATSADATAAAAAAALARKAAGAGAEDNLRVVKGAFSVSTTSSKNPKAIMAEVKRVLGGSNIAVKVISEFYIKCEAPTEPMVSAGGTPIITDKKDPNVIRFELEICALPNLTDINVVRLKRITGDTWAYKELCSKLVGQMKL